MPGLDPLRREQLELGMADWFRPYPESIAPFNQIKVDAGVFFNPSTPLPYIMGVQTSPSFVTVAPGFFRYDLVYLDASGTVQKLNGAAQVLPVTPYTGAPGFGGPAFPQGAFPIAFVLVTETGTVVVDADDITDIRGPMRHYEPGVVGDIQADGAASISVTGTRRFVPSAHRHPLNTDGVTPANTDQTGPGAPGASGKYADRAHVHQVDPLLVGRVSTLEGAASAYMDRADTLVFTPATGTIWWYNYLLHVFQGRMRAYPGGAPSGVWVSYLATQTPLQVTVDTVVAPAHGDSLAGAHVSTPQWFYIYLICKSDGSSPALVCSTQGPATGPDLSSPTFALADYVCWRFIAAIRNISDGSVPARPFEILPMVKHGRITQYRHAHRYTYAYSASWTSLSLAEVVPPTSKMVNMFAFAWGGNGNAGVRVRTGDYSVLNPQPIGGGAAIQDIIKIGAHQGWDQENSESELSGWVETDDSQQVEYQCHDYGGVSYGTYLYILGYDEFTDDPGTAI